MSLRTPAAFFRTALIFLCAVLAVSAQATDIAPFKPWTAVEPPPLRAPDLPAAERFVLPNGLVVFLLEDHELPRLECALEFHAGSLHDTDEKIGLAGLVSDVLRSGGSEKLPGDELDEWLDKRAARIWTSSDLESSSAGFSALKEDADEVLDVFLNLLQHPAFPQDKLDLALSRSRSGIARRNDNPSSVAMREWVKLLYGGRKDGKVHPFARHTEYETLAAIQRSDAVDFHKRFYQPARAILSLHGDFDRKEWRGKIEKLFGAWPAGAAEREPDLPKLKKTGEKLYIVERPRINQTTFLIGHLLELHQDSPEYPALRMMNEVLSRGMASRLFSEVRTRRGLAYSVFGGASLFHGRPGFFYCGCMTRDEQAADALQAIKDEIIKMREKGVTAEELSRARESVLNSFVFQSDTPDKILGNLRRNEFHHYPLDFDKRLFEKMQSVSLDEINKAAKKFIEPNGLLLLAVGGDGEGKGSPLRAALGGKGKLEDWDITIPAPKQAPLVLDPAKEEAGRKLLAQVLAANGGAEEFKKITSLKAGIRFHAGPITVKAAMKIQSPDKARVDIAGPFGPLSQVIGGTGRDSFFASGTNIKPVSPEEAAKSLRSLLQTDLGLFRLVSGNEEGLNVQLLEPLHENATTAKPKPENGEDDGRPAATEERTLQGVLVESKTLGRIKAYFDAQLRLVKIRQLPAGAARESDKNFSAHRAFGGLTLAGRSDDEDPKSRAKTMELLSLELNPQYPDSLFDKPEKAMGPDE